MGRIFTLLLLTAVSFGLFAQYGTPVAILEYYDDDMEIEIRGANGIVLYDIYYGMDLQEGDTIRTKKSVAEIRLDPNGSIIKLSPFTVFVIENLQKSPEESNNFRLMSGKIRAIAAKAGLGERYQIKTQSAVCGVRGTDFGVISIPGSEEKAFVVDGLIDYTNSLTNKKIQLGSGMIGDVFADVFQAMATSTEQMNELLKDVIFEQLDPKTIPGHAPVAEEANVSPNATIAKAATELDSTKESPIKKDVKKRVESEFMNYLNEFIGFEIGTVTIKGKTYSKAIVQPTFNLGKLKMSLYLPIIYEKDIFSPNDWYKPEGNYEWSFGSDQEGIEDITMDFLSDLFLKIRYIEWGKQRDPFFFKIGNLNNMTLGHGILMKNYANDSDFPTIRKIGLNLGMEGKRSGMETVVNDLAAPEIFGTRLYIKPFWKLAIGVSSVVDIDPDGDDKLDNTILFTGAADLDFPLVESDLLSFIFFADIAGMVPYMADIGSTKPKFQTDMLYDTDPSGFSMDNFRNFGWNAGLFGNIAFVDYRFEYRYFNGVFKPGFFSSSYDRLRDKYLQDIKLYLGDKDNSDYNKTIMGIYGEAGFSLFDKLNAKLGYMWPWDEDGSSEEDELLITLEILPGTVPVIDLYGSISYHRTKFFPTLIKNGYAIDEDLDLFDANTTFTGELVYPIAPTLALALIVSTSVKTLPDGSTDYKDNGSPQIVPVITIETRIGF